MPLGSKRSRLAAEREARRLAKTPAAPPPEFWLLSVQAKFARAIAEGEKIVELRRRAYNIPPNARLWFYAIGVGITAMAMVERVGTLCPRQLADDIKHGWGDAPKARIDSEDLSALTKGRGEGKNLTAYWLSLGEATLRTITLDEMRAHGVQAPQGAARIPHGHSLYNVLREAVLPF